MSRFNRFSSAAVLLVTVLTLQACEEDPLAPDPSTSVFGHDGGDVTVPMEVDATFMWIVDTEDVPEACEDTPGLAEGFGSGEATHLGRFDVTRLDHCSIDAAAFIAAVEGLAPDDPAFMAALVEHIRREGEFLWTAADGSTLSGSYELFIFAAGPGSTEFADAAFFTMTVAEGTGRFEGATGEIEADLERSTFPFSEDPLFLEKTTFPVVLEGEITIPRP